MEYPKALFIDSKDGKTCGEKVGITDTYQIVVADEDGCKEKLKAGYRESFVSSKKPEEKKGAVDVDKAVDVRPVKRTRRTKAEMEAAKAESE